MCVCVFVLLLLLLLLLFVVVCQSLAMTTRRSFNTNLPVEFIKKETRKLSIPTRLIVVYVVVLVVHGGSSCLFVCLFVVVSC